MKLSACQAFSLFQTVPGCRAFRHSVSNMRSNRPLCLSISKDVIILHRTVAFKIFLFTCICTKSLPKIRLGISLGLEMAQVKRFICLDWVSATCRSQDSSRVNFIVRRNLGSRNWYFMSDESVLAAVKAFFFLDLGFYIVL